jgi:hypothetical protein
VTHFSFVLVALSASTLAASDTRKPTLSDASARAQVIAYGQVEKLERRAGRSIATMRVDYLGRGEPTTSITFLAEPIGPFQPSASIGEHLLVFLEPSGERDPSLKVEFGGTAVLRVFNTKGHEYTASTRRYDGLRVPQHLCDAKVKYGLYDCSALLSVVLKDAHLPPLPNRKRLDATFRIATRNCGPCLLAPWLERSTTPASTDCGTSEIGGATSSVRRCVQEALAAGRPFKVLLPKQGVDSQIVDAVASDGRQTYWLHFDSSIEGGGEC